LKKGIDALHDRLKKHFGIEKHFDANNTRADEEATSRRLVNLVLTQCEEFYVSTFAALERLVGEIYPASGEEKRVEVEVSQDGVRALFREMPKFRVQ